ncbi:trypsin-like peptidase domain-containing protein [Candidatus Uabimicrobium sp. HlEnr_7]|uniref:trypsin-like peptidase domain-containing protein n=1 Tax=Candidatus Uabimicrobium helgolandensis TaxID=3095367 RepID=UPI003558EEFC
MDEPQEDVIFDKEELNNQQNENENEESSNEDDLGLQSSMELHGVVIAEFNLLSLDSPSAAPKICEIITTKPYFLIGRSVQCDYRITYKDKYVAEEQASIAYSIEDESYVIRCLAKDNPIFIDSKKVANDSKLHSGSVIKLGVATNAPKIRFYIEGQEEVHKVHKRLSDIVDSLQRGKEYVLGGNEQHNIHIEDPSISGAIVRIEVPIEGNHIVLNKDDSCDVSVSIDGSEVHKNENRILSYQKCLQVGNSFTLLHDVNKFHVPRSAQKCLMSDFIPSPERGNVYTIGKNDEATFIIDDPNAPFLLAEIEVPLEGDYFSIRKIGGLDITISIDGKIVETDPRNGSRFGVNQILSVGDYWEIRNNHRSLPALKKSLGMKALLTGFITTLVITIVILGTVFAIKKYSPSLQNIINPPNTMQLYQKNIYYIATFDKNSNQSIASGTGFLITQKDAQEKNIYYIVTCKHVIESWKFEKHQQKDGKVLDEKGILVGEQYIALWPYNSQVLDPEHSTYVLENSFNNFPGDKGIGSLKIHKVAEDEYEKIDDYQMHKKNSNGDLAILKIVLNDKDKDYNYNEWHIVEKPQLNVGEEVIVLGYSLGGGRLLNKNGVAKPVVCEGRVSSESQAPDFVELDVNQTNGSSGGPIIDKKGNIVGIVSFSDGKKNLVYGIHGKILEELMR